MSRFRTLEEITKVSNARVHSRWKGSCQSNGVRKFLTGNNFARSLFTHPPTPRFLSRFL